MIGIHLKNVMAQGQKQENTTAATTRTDSTTNALLDTCYKVELLNWTESKNFVVWYIFNESLILILMLVTEMNIMTNKVMFK